MRVAHQVSEISILSAQILSSTSLPSLLSEFLPNNTSKKNQM
jgi:hypothetical protein